MKPIVQTNEHSAVGMTRTGSRVRVTARRIGSLFKSRGGQDYGPSMWEYQVRVGRRFTRLTMTMPVRKVRADVRRLANRLARSR